MVDATNGLYSPCVPNICTISGKEIDIFAISLEDIVLEDIVHALSLINRYNGHTRYPYTVAQHSVYVSQMEYKHSKNARKALAALMHDAAEAYIGDIVRPVKNTLKFVLAGMASNLKPTAEADMLLRWEHKIAHCESRIQDLIYKKFYCIPTPTIKLWDDMVAATEVQTFFGRNIGVQAADITIMQVKDPYNMFWHEYRKLRNLI